MKRFKRNGLNGLGVAAALILSFGCAAEDGTERVTEAEHALRVAVPARIQAESYERAFENTPASNAGAQCNRGDGVDMELTTDPNGGNCNIGWTTPGEWLEYDISTPTTQSFNIALRVASDVAGRTFRLELDGVSLGSRTSPSPGWQAFQDRTYENVTIAAGDHVLRVVFETGDVNLNYLELTANATTTCLEQPLTRVAAVASSLETPAFGAGLAIDNNTSTRWASAYSNPQWIDVDLGATRKISRVVLNWETAASANYDIAVSDSASGPWNVIYTTSAGDGGIDTITGLNAKARYVRMYSRARTTQWGNSLWEFQVYGDANPNCDASACNKPNSVALVVDDAFKTPLQTELQQLASDIETDLDVCVRTIPISASTTAQNIRTQLKNLFSSAGLRGAVLIGDVPGVQLGDLVFNGQTVPPLLTDSYYEVLNDAFWKDPDGNGIYNRALDLNGNGQHSDPEDLRYDLTTPERDRDIWTGRLLPPRAFSFAERVNQLRAYLQRNHAYRTGQKNYDLAMTFFDSIGHNQLNDQEYDQATDLAHAQQLYSDLSLYSTPASSGLSVVWNSDLNTQLASWQNLIGQPKEYAYINVHGAFNLQQFGPAQFMSSSGYVTHAPRTLLIDMSSCNNAMFQASDYLAGYALFTGETLAVRANTTEVAVAGHPSITFEQRLLAHGLTLGDIKRSSGIHDSAHILGDPTLRLRQPGTGPTLSFSPANLAYPDLTASALTPGFSVERAVTLTNTGSAPITIYKRQDLDASFNASGVIVHPRFLTFPDDEITFPITLNPGESRNVRIYFNSEAANPRPGTYHYKTIFYTTSPSIPTFTVTATQRLL